MDENAEEDGDGYNLADSPDDVIVQYVVIYVAFILVFGYVFLYWWLVVQEWAELLETRVQPINSYSIDGRRHSVKQDQVAVAPRQPEEVQIV